jgi:hypothetical protein
MTPDLSTNVRQIPVLLRGEEAALQGWIRDWQAGRTIFQIFIVIVGGALYGAAIGFWRDPMQSVYTAIKLPLLILTTTFATALLNGMLASLLGLNLRFRQSLLTILTSFSISSAVLGSFSPILFFVAWNTPPVSRTSSAGTSHSILLLTEVAVIAFAGLVANLRLRQLLRRLSGSTAVAQKILFAWLATNLFLGSQVSWILRPFVGSPGLPVEFLRADAFQGSFYEAVFHAIKRLFFS